MNEDRACWSDFYKFSLKKRKLIVSKLFDKVSFSFSPQKISLIKSGKRSQCFAMSDGKTKIFVKLFLDKEQHNLAKKEFNQTKILRKKVPKIIAEPLFVSEKEGLFISSFIEGVRGTEVIQLDKCVADQLYDIFEKITQLKYEKITNFIDREWESRKEYLKNLLEDGFQKGLINKNQKKGFCIYFNKYSEEINIQHQNYSIVLGDFSMRNILFDDKKATKIVGIFDFEYNTSGDSYDNLIIFELMIRSLIKKIPFCSLFDYDILSKKRREMALVAQSLKILCSDDSKELKQIKSEFINKLLISEMRGT